jgi:hypothetical protein
MKKLFFLLLVTVPFIACPLAASETPCKSNQDCTGGKICGLNKPQNQGGTFICREHDIYIPL